MRRFRWRLQTAKATLIFFADCPTGPPVRGPCAAAIALRSKTIALPPFSYLRFVTNGVYTFDRNGLKREFGDALVGLVDRMALRPGDLTSHNPNTSS